MFVLRETFYPCSSQIGIITQTTEDQSLLWTFWIYWERGRHFILIEDKVSSFIKLGSYVNTNLSGAKNDFSWFMVWPNSCNVLQVWFNAGTVSGFDFPVIGHSSRKWMNLMYCFLRWDAAPTTCFTNSEGFKPKGRIFFFSYLKF